MAVAEGLYVVMSSANLTVGHLATRSVWYFKFTLNIGNAQDRQSVLKLQSCNSHRTLIDYDILMF